MSRKSLILSLIASWLAFNLSVLLTARGYRPSSPFREAMIDSWEMMVSFPADDPVQIFVTEALFLLPSVIAVGAVWIVVSLFHRERPPRALVIIIGSTILAAFLGSQFATWAEMIASV